MVWMVYMHVLKTVIITVFYKSVLIVYTEKNGVGFTETILTQKLLVNFIDTYNKIHWDFMKTKYKY